MLPVPATHTVDAHKVRAYREARLYKPTIKQVSMHYFWSAEKTGQDSEY